MVCSVKTKCRRLHTKCHTIIFSGDAVTEFLPEQFEAELDLARAGGGAGDGAGGAGEAGGIGGGGRSEDDEVGSVEIGAVEEIEDFGAELQVEALADGGVFQHGKIPGGQGGADVRIAADVAVKAAGGGRSDKGSGI